MADHYHRRDRWDRERGRRSGYYTGGTPGAEFLERCVCGNALVLGSMTDVPVVDVSSGKMQRLLASGRPLRKPLYVNCECYYSWELNA